MTAMPVSRHGPHDRGPAIWLALLGVVCLQAPLRAEDTAPTTFQDPAAACNPVAAFQFRILQAEVALGKPPEPFLFGAEQLEESVSEMAERLELLDGDHDGDRGPFYQRVHDPESGCWDLNPVDFFEELGSNPYDATYSDLTNEVNRVTGIVRMFPEPHLQPATFRIWKMEGQGYGSSAADAFADALDHAVEWEMVPPELTGYGWKADYYEVGEEIHSRVVQLTVDIDVTLPTDALFPTTLGGTSIEAYVLPGFGEAPPGVHYTGFHTMEPEAPPTSGELQDYIRICHGCLHPFARLRMSFPPPCSELDDACRALEDDTASVWIDLHDLEPRAEIPMFGLRCAGGYSGRTPLMYVPNTRPLAFDGFGPGWSWLFESRLRINGPSVLLELPSGKSVPFIGSAANATTYATWPGAGYQLDRIAPTTWRLITPLKRTFTFAAVGDGSVATLRSLTEPGGKTTQLVRNAEGKLLAIRLPDRRSVYITNRDTQGRIRTIRLSDGRTTSLAYDPQGRLASLTAPDGQIIRLGYCDDAGAELCSLEEGEHQWLILSSPTGNRKIVDLQRPDGGVIHHEQGRFEPERDRFILQPDGSEQWVRGVMTIHGFQVAVRSVLSDPQASDRSVFSYDPCGAVAGVVHPGEEQAETLRTNNNAGAPLEIMHPNGALESFEYAPDGIHAQSHQSPTGDHTDWVYDDLGRMLRKAVTLHTAANRTVSLVTEYEYHPQSGAVARIQVPGGAEERFEYDLFGRLSATVDRFGQRTDITYDSAGRVRLESQSNGWWVQYTYDALDRVVEERFSDGSTNRFEYDHFGPTAFIDRLGRRSEFTTNASGQILETRHPDGAISLNRFDTMGRLVEAIDPLGRTTRYLRQPELNQVRTEFPDGSMQVKAFDAQGRLVADTEPGGAMTLYLYDAMGALVAIEHPTGMIENRTVDAQGRMLQRDTFPYGTNSARRTEQFAYDALNRLVRHVHPDGAIETFEYDARGLLEHRDPHGGITRDLRDSAGRLLVRTDPDQHSVRFTYGTGSKPISAQNDDGDCWTWTYDLEGRLIEETEPEDGRHTLLYDSAGQLLKVTDASGYWIEYHYDARGRLIRSTDSLGQTEIVWRNAAGEVIQSSAADGLLRWYEYDPLGRVTREVGSPGTERRTEWSAVGPIQRWVNNRLEQQWTYQESGLPATEWSLDRPDITFTYNQAGERLRAVIQGEAGDPLQTFSWGYDSCGRLLRRTTSEGGSWFYRRATGGRITSIQAPDRTSIQMQYSPGGLLIGTSGDDGELAQYEYDVRGRIVRMTDAFGVTRFEYSTDDHQVREIDPFGNEITVTMNSTGRPIQMHRRLVGGQTWTLDYQYDQAGRMTCATDGIGQTTRTYLSGQKRPYRIARAGAGVTIHRTQPGGRITGVNHTNASNQIIGRELYYYDAFGRIERWNNELFGTCLLEHDGAGRILELEPLTSDAPLAANLECAYSWDRFGNLLLATEGHRTFQGTRAWGNQLGQAQVGDHWDLLAALPVDWSGTVLAWIHGIPAHIVGSKTGVIPNGIPIIPRNQTQIVMRLSGTNQIRTATCQHPVAEGALVPQYDTRDNLFGRGGFAFTYNEFNQLIGVETPTAEQWHFVYDGLGRRRITQHFATNGTILQHTLHLYQGRLRIEDIDLQSGASIRYARGQDCSGTMEDAGGAEGLLWALFSEEPGTPYYYLHDGRGNCSGLLRSGAADWSARYACSPFGHPWVDQETALPAPQPFRMQGKPWLAELGLYDFGRRFYDPMTMRWLTPDPKGEEAGWNLYEPFQGDPWSRIDPWGEDIIVIIDRDVVMRQGHVGVAIGQPGDSYFYFSFEKGCSLLTAKDNVDALYFQSLQDAVQGLGRYDEYILFKCPPDKDRAAIRGAMRWFDNRYNLFTRNCKDFVRALLDLAGKETENAWRPIQFMEENQPSPLLPSHSGKWDWESMQDVPILFTPWQEYYNSFEVDSIRAPILPPMKNQHST